MYIYLILVHISKTTKLVQRESATNGALYKWHEMYVNEENISTLTQNEYIIWEEAHKSVVFIRCDLRQSWKPTFGNR